MRVLTSWSRRQGSLDRGQDVLLGRETHLVVLLRDDGISYPDGELTAAPFDELDVDSGVLLDDGCRTDSTRTIVSDFAVANTDGLHQIIIPHGPPHSAHAISALECCSSGSPAC
jgi:hypothetical protein